VAEQPKKLELTCEQQFFLQSIRVQMRDLDSREAVEEFAVGVMKQALLKENFANEQLQKAWSIHKSR